MDLPALDLEQGPTRHPHCCLGLSSALLTTLTTIIVEDDAVSSGDEQIVLSIGSGTGLFEALLASHSQRIHDSSSLSRPRLVVEGVEVLEPRTGGETANKYLSEQYINTVRNSWEVTSRLRDLDVSAVMFVFPRQPTLVTRYIDRIREDGLAARMVIWLGPVADWVEFEPCFVTENGESLEVRRMENTSGELEACEMMAVWRRPGKPREP